MAARGCPCGGREKSLTDEERGARYRSEIISELISPSTKWVEVREPQSAIEDQLDKWIKQVSETNNELATALSRIKHSFEVLLAGQKIADANEVLSQVEGALKSASMVKNVAQGSLPRVRATLTTVPESLNRALSNIRTSLSAVSISNWRSAHSPIDRYPWRQATPQKSLRLFYLPSAFGSYPSYHFRI